MIRALAVLLAAAAFAGAGCGSTPTSPSDAPLRLTVTQNPTLTADSLSFTLRLENISRTAVNLTFPSSCDVLPFFSDAAGRAVTPLGGGFACATVITHGQLVPGESLIRSIMVKAGTKPEEQMVVLPAGTYSLHARLMDSDFKLQSTPVTVILR
jgi:hypothetical protein